MELSQVLNALGDLGALGASALVIWALVTERLVPRGRVDELLKERDDIRLERRTNDVASRKSMTEALQRLEKLTHQIERMADELAHERKLR